MKTTKNFSVFEPRFKPRSSQTRSRNASHLAATFDSVVVRNRSRKMCENNKEDITNTECLNKSTWKCGVSFFISFINNYFCMKNYMKSDLRSHLRSEINVVCLSLSKNHTFAMNWKIVSKRTTAKISFGPSGGTWVKMVGTSYYWQVTFDVNFTSNLTKFNKESVTSAVWIMTCVNCPENDNCNVWRNVEKPSTLYTACVQQPQKKEEMKREREERNQNPFAFSPPPHLKSQALYRSP
jgi:hypothetical protein